VCCYIHGYAFSGAIFKPWSVSSLVLHLWISLRCGLGKLCLSQGVADMGMYVSLFTCACVSHEDVH
jgi:hypothetical protein